MKWFGHLDRKGKDDWVSACRDVIAAGAKGKGRGKKTWEECVTLDLKSLGVKREVTQSRSAWRGLIVGKPSTRF